MENNGDNSHQCKAVVIHCIDFRIQQGLSGYLQSNFPQACDVISTAGGIQGLIKKREQSRVYQDIETSLNLHQPERVILIQHEDCGAYGGSDQFDDIKEEQEFQGEELSKARGILSAAFPNATIETYFLSLSGNLMPTE